MQRKSMYDKIISCIIYVTIFLMPIFFLPFTRDAVEFNKQFLLYFLVIAGILAWVAKGIGEKQLKFKKTPFDLPILIFLAVLIIASIFSKSRVLSIWGDFASFSSSLLSFVFYILFYYLVLNNIKSVKQVSKIILLLATSTLLSVLYFLVAGFNILPLEQWSLPKWTIASDLPTHFGYFLALALILVISSVMYKKKSFWNLRGAVALIFSIFIFAGIVVLGFKSVWLITAIAAFLLLVFALSRIEDVSVPWVSITFGVLVIAILFVLLGTPQFITAKLPTEIALSPTVSWKIVSAELSENLKTFLLGTGPGTFVYNFSSHRPDIFNNNFAWSLRFSKPHNSGLELLSTLGVLGAVAWVALMLSVVGTLFVMWFVNNVRLKKKSLEKISDLIHLGEGGSAYEHALFAGLMTGWLVLLISMFLITFSTVHWFMFFLLLALAFLVGMDFAEKESGVFTISLKTLPQFTLVASFVYILIFAVIVVLLIFLGRFYTAEVYRARAAKFTTVGNHTQAAASLFKAVSLNPNYAQYYLELASSYIGMATVNAQSGTPDQQQIANLIASAVNQAREATRLAPNDAATWDFLSSMYATARPLSANANNFVMSSLEKAIELEKTNPRLYHELARAKILNKDYKGARDALERSIVLKQNYILAYVTLSQLDEVEEKQNEAIEHISVAAALSPNDPTLLFNLGRLYYNRAKGDDLARAEQLFAMALSINTNYADALWSLGVLYERQGKVSNALELYRRVSALNPGNEEVKKKINRLLGQ